MLHQSNDHQDPIEPQETFNHDAQTIIASTFLQMDELSDVVISQLAEEFENKLMADFTTQKSVFIDETARSQEQTLQTTIQQTLNLLIEVKFYLTLLLELYLKDKSNNQVIKEIEEDIRKFRKTIMLMQSQMSMALWIQQHKKRPHFKEKYYQKFNELHHFAIQLQTLNDGFINIKLVVELLQTCQQILHQYINSIIELKESIQKKRRSKYLLRGLNRLCVVNTKVLTISEVFPYCCIVSKDDLFCFDLDHPRWRKLISQCIVYRSFADKDSLKQSFDNLKKNLNLVNATMGIFDKTRKLPLSNVKTWLEIVNSSKYLMKLFLFQDAAQKQAEYMICSSNTQLMKEVWNLPQHKVFRDVAEFLLPAVEHSERLYIPRIAIDYFNSNGKNLPDMSIPYLSNYGNQLFKKKPYDKSLRIRVNSKFKLIPKFKTIDEKTKKSSQGTGLIVQKIGNAILKIGNLCNPKPKYVPEKLVFHVHGGGFISMSSFIHQIYVRAWTKQLQIPFVSVDYGKAPEHPYPESLYDCLEAYLWVLYCFEQLYEAKPKRIIFLGDSAGGNLVAALINLCIAWKLRVPDGLVMCYPVLKVDSKSYTRSLLGTLEDMILPHTMLKLCAQSYTPNFQNAKDPLVSPLQTPDQFLAQFPQTRIFVGSKDPFHDDCCRFTEKMNTANPGKCILTIYEEFPHGFLQFDLKTNPHEFGRKANEEICNSIREMFDSFDKKLQKQQK